MSSQLDRYRATVSYIHEHFREKVDIEAIERVSHYSYRNINRIFLSLTRETIGKYIKRLRLEKGAEYIKYSDQQLADIAMEVGFADLAAFSKAFKKRFGYAPSVYRKQAHQSNHQKVEKLQTGHEHAPLPFQLETLPRFTALFYEHRGSYTDYEAIENSWQKLLVYGEQHKLISKKTLFFSEALDDNEISDEINCRTNLAIMIDERVGFKPSGLFFLKEHEPQKYARFVHVGPTEQLESTYNRIYASWLTSIQLEFADKPTLEFYVNHDPSVPSAEFLTEIYIPVI